MWLLPLLVMAAAVVLVLTEVESPWQEWAAWTVVTGAAGFALWMLSQGVGS